MKRFIGLSIFATMAFGCGDDGSSCPAGTIELNGICVPVMQDGAVADAGPGTDSDVRFDVVPMVDAGPDPFDGGPNFDGGPDAVPPLGCDMYDVPCTPDRGCLQAGFVCQGERAISTGGGTDPIMNAPMGMETYSGFIFKDGMCTPAGIQTTGAPEACDATDPDETACGTCGDCVDLGGVTMCLRSCEPSVTDNDVCRDNYNCSLTEAVCLPLGCSTDIECRVARQDTNGIPGLQTPTDCMTTPAVCGGGMNNFDALVYDTASMATCNTDTYECSGSPSTPTASGGDACASDADCEDGGFCIEEGGSCDTNGDIDCVNDAGCTAAITGAATDGTCDIAWTGGACIKLGCDVPGNECANDGVCQERGLGVTGCLTGCTVGAGADEMNPASWVDPVTGAGGCRTGYSCFWNGVGAHGVANNGVCLPGEFNDITESNVGSTCDTSADCFGPFGLARCLRFDDLDEFGYCTVNDCTQPFFDAASMANVCGGENICVNFGEDTDPFGLCIERCESGADCEGVGIGCGAITDTIDGCFPGCSEAVDCQLGSTCEGATAMMAGECVPATCGGVGEPMCVAGSTCTDGICVPTPG